MWFSPNIFFLSRFESSGIRTVFIKNENRGLKQMLLLFLIPWRGLGKGQERQTSAKERRTQKYQVGEGFPKTRVGSTRERDGNPTPHATLGRGKLQTSRWTVVVDHLGKLCPRNQGFQLVQISVPKHGIKPTKLLDSKAGLENMYTGSPVFFVFWVF